MGPHQNSEYGAKTLCLSGSVVSPAVQQDGNGANFSCSNTPSAYLPIGCGELVEATPQLGDCESNHVCGRMYPLESSNHVVIWYWQGESTASNVSSGTTFYANCQLDSFYGGDLTFKNCVLVAPVGSARTTSQSSLSQSSSSLTSVQSSVQSSSSGVADITWGGGILHASDFSSSGGINSINTAFACNTGGYASSISLQNSGSGAVSITGVSITYQGSTSEFTPSGSCTLALGGTIIIGFVSGSHLAVTPTSGGSFTLTISFSNGSTLQETDTFV